MLLASLKEKRLRVLLAVVEVEEAVSVMLTVVPLRRTVSVTPGIEAKGEKSVSFTCLLVCTCYSDCKICPLIAGTSRKERKRPLLVERKQRGRHEDSRVLASKSSTSARLSTS